METFRQELLAALGQAARENQRAIDALDDAVAKKLGVNRTDLRTLDVLFDAPASPGTLAAKTGMSPAAMTAALDRLERRGYVRRVPAAGDRRRIVVETTELSKRLAGRLYGPIADEGLAQAAGYTDEQLVLLRDFLIAGRDLQDRHRERVNREVLDLER